MWHQEKDTLNLLGKYSREQDKSKNTPNEDKTIIKEKIIYRDMGKFNTKKEKRFEEKKEISIIPNFVWYSITLFFCIYIAREIFLINQMNKAFEAGNEMNKMIINESQKTINMFRNLEKPNFQK